MSGGLINTTTLAWFKQKLLGVVDDKLAGKQNNGECVTSLNGSKGDVTLKDYVIGLSVSGKTVTYTKKDGTSGTITTQDTDTVYTHPNSGVTAGSYNKVTVNAQGHVTAGENVSIVKTVNGAVPDANGNVTVTASADPLAAYPVGSIYMSVNSTSPATLFGGTWEAIAGGRVLIGQNTSYPAGSTGGEATHTLTTGEMPSHSHSGSTGSAGSHTHSASTSSTGSHSHSAARDGGSGTAVKAAGYYTRAPIYDIPTTSAGSHSHTVSVGSDGSHTHSVTIGSAGGGAAHNNMPPYLSVYMWKRTA